MKRVIIIMIIVVLLCGCATSGDINSMPSSLSSASNIPASSIDAAISEDTALSENGETVRPYFMNTLDEAEYLQSSDGVGQSTRFCDYVYTINTASYSSLVELYAAEPKLPFIYLAEIQLDSLPEYITRQYDNEYYIDYDSSTFATWVIEQQPDYFGNIALGLLDKSDVDVDFDTEYLIISVNRRIIQLSIYYGENGDSGIMPFTYVYGILPPDYPRRPRLETENGYTYKDGGWYDNEGHEVGVTDIDSVDSARCIFSNEFTPNMIYLYKMARNVQPFNMFGAISLENYVFNEYAQVELASTS